MRRLAALVAVLLAVTAACSSAGARAAGRPTVYVVNHSTLVTDSQVADAIPAFQAAVDDDFAPVWAAAGELELTTDVPAGGWSIELVDTAGCWACAGYHDLGDGQVPYAQVGVDGDNWQLVFTHELFEMLADPYVDRAEYVRDCGQGLPFDSPCSTGRFYAVEVSDPVEQLHWAYNRKSASGRNVVISDFVTPRWYSCQGGGRLDMVGHVRHCRRVLYGGYVWYSQDGSWEQIGV